MAKVEQWPDMFPSLAPFVTGSLIKNKERMQLYYNRYYVDRLLSMFKYDGLPDSLPQKYLEMYLITSGTCGILRDDNGDLRAIFGYYGGQPDVYYIPKYYYYANPYLEKQSKSDVQFEIGRDIEVIRNDTTMTGLMPMINRYTALMVENAITARIECINMRRVNDMAAPDDKTKKSAELYLERIEQGELGVMADNALLDGIKVIPTRTGQTNNMTSIIEFQQYLKASFYNEIGLNANWNAKRESVSSNEAQLNDDQLTPLIDNMLAEGKEGLEKVNALFGTNITVDFNSAWKENEIEKDLIMDQMETAAEGETIQQAEDEKKEEGIEAEAEDKKEGDKDE